MKNKNKIKILDYVIIVLGALIYSLSVNIFTAPNNIAPGGLTGVATVLNHLFTFPIGVTMLVLNIPLLIWGAVENGRKFLAKTIVATLLISVFIDVSANFIPSYSGNQMLAAIFGGILSGTGLGLIFYRGGTTGGTDIMGRNIHKRLPHISMGNIILAIDAIIIAAAGFAYESIESALYAVIAIFVSTKLIDTIVYGVAGDNGKLMIIITTKGVEITNLLMQKIERGVTLIDAYGGYNGEDKQVLMCALRPQQVHKASMTIKGIDKDAFVIVTTATEINGAGFKGIIT